MKKMYSILTCLIVLLSLFSCTKQGSEPIVIELEVIPGSFTIEASSFLSKPFTVRAKYSDDKIENVSNKVRWISENSSLINVSSDGELQKQGVCTLAVCTVSLVVTHPESGQSQRVEVKLFPEKVKQSNADKNAPASTSESESDAGVDSAKTEVPSNNSSSTSDDEPTGDGVGSSDKSVLSSETPDSLPIDSAKISQDNKIVNIAFSSDLQLLTSGQLFRPEVVTISDLLKTVVAESNYTCVLENLDSDVLAISNNCNLRAMAPGKARVTLLTNSTEFVSNSVLDVEVSAWELPNSQISSLNVTLAENQSQTWLKLTGVTPGETMRYSAKGLLDIGLQLYTLNSIDSNQGACLNTVPAGFNEVACIIKPQFDQLYLVLQKPGVGISVLNLTSVVLPAEILTYSLVNNSDNPQDLIKENKIRAYVLANEFGLYSRHFYQYTPGAGDENGFRILLSEFDAAPSLEVFWANGYCTENMLKVSASSVACGIPSDSVGNLWITINGNMGGGVFNGPAAQWGGTYYTLQVTNLR